MRRIACVAAIMSLLCAGLASPPIYAQVVTETYNGGVLSNPKIGMTTFTSAYRPQTGFTANGFNYSVILNPLHPAFQDDPTANYLSILNGQNTNPTGLKVLTFGNVWDFPTASGGGPDFSLSPGSINVRRYTAEASGGGFGLDFWADYNPMGADPNGVGGVNGVGDMHWIQVINDNWNISDPNLANRGPGKPERIVDVDVSPPQKDPYYDNGGAANNMFFLDTPRRTQSGVNGQSFFWNAELFVVKEVVHPTFDMNGDVVTKGKIQVYDGIRYGFVAVTPELPVTTDLLMFAAAAFLLVRLRRAKRT